MHVLRLMFFVAALGSPLLIGCGGEDPAAARADAAERIERALQGLNSRDPTARALSASALGMIGPEAASAVDKLEPLLQDRDPRVREAAQKAIKRISGE